MAARRDIDWEAIEYDYRAGVKTLRNIASDYGITHGAINKRAKRDGWCRDLSGKIKAKAESLVSKSLVSPEVSKVSKATERSIIEANAEAIKDVQLSHRKDIQRHRSIVMSLSAELEAQTGDPDLFSQLGELMKNSDGVDRLNDLYNKVCSLPGRVDCVRKLSESLKTLIGLERQAFKMDDDTGSSDTGPMKWDVHVTYIDKGQDK